MNKIKKVDREEILLLALRNSPGRKYVWEGCIEKEGIINDIEDIQRSKRLREFLANTKFSKKHYQASSHNPKGLRRDQ